MTCIMIIVVDKHFKPLIKIMTQYSLSVFIFLVNNNLQLLNNTMTGFIADFIGQEVNIDLKKLVML